MMNHHDQPHQPVVAAVHVFDDDDDYDEDDDDDYYDEDEILVHQRISPLSCTAAATTASPNANSNNMTLSSSPSSSTTTTSSSPCSFAGTTQAMLPMHKQRKVGKTFFGCCDYRRAVIIINTLFIGLISFGITFIQQQQGGEEGGQEGEGLSVVVVVEDDDDIATRIIKFLLYVSVVTATFAVIGAWYFRIWPVVLHCIVLTVEFILFQHKYFEDNNNNNYNDDDEQQQQQQQPSKLSSIPSPLFNFLGSSILITVYLFHHMRYISEIRTGLLSRQTYPREEYCYGCSSLSSIYKKQRQRMYRRGEEEDFY